MMDNKVLLSKIIVKQYLPAFSSLVAVSAFESTDSVIVLKIRSSINSDSMEYSHYTTDITDLLLQEIRLAMLMSTVKFN